MPYPEEKEIVENIDKGLIRDAKRWNKRVTYRSNWASEIGHSCERYLTYNWTHWAERQLPDKRLLGIFRMGKYIEMVATELLQVGGYEIYEDPETVHIEKYNIGCKLDRKIKFNGEILPLEIKGLSQHTVKDIKDIDSLLNNDRYYLRKYPAQLLAYCVQGNKEKGMMCVVDKQMIEAHPLLCYTKQYEDYIDQVFRKIDRVNRFVRAYKKSNGKNEDKRPKRFFDLDMCSDCCYNHICKPIFEASKKAGKMKVPNDLLEKITRALEIKPDHAEYTKLDKQIKDYFKAQKLKETVVIGKGEFLVETKKSHRNPQPAKDGYDYYTYKIKEIKE